MNHKLVTFYLCPPLASFDPSFVNQRRIVSKISKMFSCCMRMEIITGIATVTKLTVNRKSSVVICSSRLHLMTRILFNSIKSIGLETFTSTSQIKGCLLVPSETTLHHKQELMVQTEIRRHHDSSHHSSAQSRVNERVLCSFVAEIRGEGVGQIDR